jgi:hypothetical protein
LAFTLSLVIGGGLIVLSLGFIAEGVEVGLEADGLEGEELLADGEGEDELEGGEEDSS